MNKSIIAGLAITSAITIPGVADAISSQEILPTNSNISSSNMYFTRNNLNLRKDMSTSSRVLRTIPKGEQVQKLSSKYGWAKVSYKGLVGYCNELYLTSINPISQNTNNTLLNTTFFVNTEVLNARVQPNTDSKIYKKLYKGDSVLVLKQRNDGWSEIVINENIYYVSSTYLSKDNVVNNTVSSITQYVNVPALYARTQPNVNSSIVEKLGLDTEVKVLEKRTDGWTKVSVNDRDLYVSSRYLSDKKVNNTQLENNATKYKYSYEAITPTNKSAFASIQNLKLALNKINGTIVKPGETFYYLKAIGPITKANGFVESGVILNGKPSTGVGGGICQGSTTLHNAVIKTGLKVVERRNHSLPSKYADKGLDAMVTGNLDYGFTNTSKYDIRIVGYVASGNAIVKLESTGDITNGYTYKPEVKISKDGLEAITTIKKIKDGLESVHQTFYSLYKSK